MTFLEQAARYIFGKYDTPAQLEHICVVLPTKRAVYFFKRAIACCSDRAFVAPEVVAMDDFVADRCGVQIADNVGLLFELYDVFKQTNPNISFERYLQWASVLLRDFEMIDQYMADAPYVFGYISEAKALERWRMEWPNSPVATDSVSVKNYFEL
ncbi:MAG: PD-(D/E)XK nuclease family protein, partial [Runella slithyformis]